MTRQRPALRTRGGGPDLSHLERLLGDLLVEEEIARTPRAVIYRIRSGGAGERPSALKVGLQPLDAEDLIRFRHEVRLLSEVRHPSVVQVFDYGVLPGDFPFLTMEMVAGGDLRGALAGATWDRLLDFAIQASAGLAHIHRHGILHLDLKPENLGLAVSPAGELRVKILDFGLSQSARGPLDRKIRGTLPYVAPEMLLQDSYDQRADLYSLGMTLFELATGVLPSAGDDLAAIRFHLEGELPDPFTLRPDLPPRLGEVLLRLLRRDPRERYPSAGHLLVDLASLAGRELDAAQLAFGEGMVLSSNLVGRESPLAELRAALARAGAGAGGVLLLEGGEGIGKSRLLREFRLFAALEGATVAAARASLHRPQPLQPVLEALRQLRLEPVASEEGAPDVVTSVGVEAERFALFREIAASLEKRAAREGPIVLILDDLHHASADSLELVGFLARELAASRTLVIAARRPVPRAALELDLLAQVEELARLHLAPLARDETARLVGACLGSEELPTALTDWVQLQSAGVPGRVALLLRHLIDERVLRFRGGEWKPSLPALSRLATAPGGTDELDRQQLAALPLADREALDVAAVLGEPFRLELLADLLARAPEEVYELLARLQEARLVERHEESGSTLYAIAQARLRESLYEALGDGPRRRLHLAIAERLERRARDGREELSGEVAEHYWQAGERRRSLPFLLAAGRAATAVHGHAAAASSFGRAVAAATEEGDLELAARARVEQSDALAAAGQYGKALRILEELLGEGGVPGRRAEDRELRAGLEVKVARLQARLGDHEAALGACEAGLAQLRGLDLPELEIDLLHGKAGALRDLGDPAAGFAAAREALRRASTLGLHRQRAALLNTLGMSYYSRGDWRRAGRLMRRGLTAAALAADDRLQVKLRNNLGNVLWKTGDYAGAFRHYEENLGFCERVRDPWGQLSALNNLGILECSRGNWRGAREPLSRSFELARRLHAREAETLARLNLAEVEEMLGDWPRARRLNEKVLRLLAENPDHGNRLTAVLQLGSLARKRGDHEEARSLAAETLAGAERIADGDLATLARLQLGLIDKDRERFAGAAGELDAALSMAQAAGTRESIARIELARADLALRQGGREEAGLRTAAARRVVEQLGDRGALAELMLLEARLAFERDAGDEADRLFAAGVRLFEELELPFEYAHGLVDWGVRSATATHALERLDRALVAFDRLGATAEAERVRGAMELVRERQRFEAGRRGSPGLYEVAKLINSSLDQGEVLARTMDIVLARLRAERGMVVLWSSLTHELEIAAARNLGGEEGGEGRQLSETVVRRVLESREPVLAVDALADPRFAGAGSIVASHIVSILCVPLAIRDRLIGAIYIDHRRSRDLFGQKDLEFLLAFADQAAIALENARLFGELSAARERLKAENEALRSEVLSSRHLGALIGKSRAIRELKETLERIALSSSTILVRGESGTGKGLVARTLHAISPRRSGPFIQFNCAALPETLVESELFGHERGAFTGAVGQKPGRFELAHGGTIFLDEIGKVSRSVQAKLLRVVEDKEFERVGGTKTLRADVRIVTATNLDLEDAIVRGEFREDLYYRLNIIPIVLPPLRERREDVPFLVDHFLSKIARDLGQPRRGLDASALELFASHRWPGNIRELEATIHRALVLSARDPLSAVDFAWIAGGDAPRAVATPRQTTVSPAAEELGDGGYERAMDALDRELIARGLAACGGRIREAARLLGIARNTLKAKMKKYDLAGRE